MVSDPDEIIIPPGAGTFRAGHGYTILHQARCLTYGTNVELQVEGASFRLRSLSIDRDVAPPEILRTIEQKVIAEGYFKYIAVICNNGTDVRIYFVTNFSDHDRDDDSEPTGVAYHPDTQTWNVR